MKRATIVALVGALVVALAVAPLGAASVGTDAQPQTDADDSDETTPGERLSGVVAVQNAEIDGEVTERTYGVKLANAQSDEAKADVVNEQIDDVEQRLDDVEQRLDDLEDARESGEITEGQYRAEVATVAAERATVERLAEDANATASELPPEHAVDVDALAELRERANELTGPEVAEIAQSIAGDRVGQTPAADREPGAPIDVPGQERGDNPADETPADDEPGNETSEDDDQTESSETEVSDEQDSDTGDSGNR
ncbi:hypothetical protein [Natronobacterium texcoconense]|nr:hypothetical protein [Natronobacterium texcoconense]